MYTKLDLWHAYCTLARLKRELAKVNEMIDEANTLILRSNQLLKESVK